jgi:hypothetical protein
VPTIEESELQQIRAHESEQAVRDRLRQAGGPSRANACRARSRSNSGRASRGRRGRRGSCGGRGSARDRRSGPARSCAHAGNRS